MCAVDGFGKPIETCAFAKEFGAHRDNDMDFGVALVHRGRRGRWAQFVWVQFVRRVDFSDKEINKEFRLLAADFAFEPEQFLELIDQNAQPLAGKPLNFTCDRCERRSAAVE